MKGLQLVDWTADLMAGKWVGKKVGRLVSQSVELTVVALADSSVALKAA